MILNTQAYRSFKKDEVCFLFVEYKLNIKYKEVLLWKPFKAINVRAAVRRLPMTETPTACIARPAAMTFLSKTCAGSARQRAKRAAARFITGKNIRRGNSAKQRILTFRDIRVRHAVPRSAVTAIWALVFVRIAATR